MRKKGSDILSTFMFKSKTQQYTPISNVFIDKYMPNARGEFIKVYILALKYCISGEAGVNSSIMASVLHLLESDIINAFNYWSNEGVIKMTSADNMGNYFIEFYDLSETLPEKEKSINLMEELGDPVTKEMLEDIQRFIGRTLSSKEMEMYLSWKTDFSFPPELILLLIQYCVSRGKVDYRYFEKIAISWHDSNITSIDDAQSYIKKHEDKWIKIRKILEYLGIKDAEIMKPQEDMLNKWINTYKFSLEIIFKAIDLCFERINKAEFKYIDGILNSWFKEGLSTLEEIAKKDIKRDGKKSFYKNSSTETKKSTFNNFEQRNYDFDELEKKLLGREDNND